MPISPDHRPLAERLRPTALSEVAGQTHLLAAGKPLAEAFRRGAAHSMILWGPPGTGKTTLARLTADAFGARWVAISAVLSGVKDIRAAIDAAAQSLTLGERTILFVDEVHRFNKAQQDAFLPHVEAGTITLIGATTENPAFELNNALLSRCRVYVLKPLDDDALLALVERGSAALGVTIEAAARKAIVRAADGDARRLLMTLEIAAGLSDDDNIDLPTIATAVGSSMRRFDKGGDDFYDQISALHKAVRGSDPDASLYWLCRMLDGGADPRYIARRVIRMASEDIGLADPRALAMTLDAAKTYERLGSPEGELAIAQTVIYLAVAAKSNAAYVAYKAAMKAARSSGSQAVPEHLRNAPTQLAKSLGHGKGYQYDHDTDNGVAVSQTYFPEALGTPQFYEPTHRGLEQRIAEKLQQLRNSRES